MRADILPKRNFLRTKSSIKNPTPWTITDLKFIPRVFKMSNEISSYINSYLIAC